MRVQFTKITPFSKALALILFILLPIFTFVLGIKLTLQIAHNSYKHSISISQPNTSPTPAVSNVDSTFYSFPIYSPDREYVANAVISSEHGRYQISFTLGHRENGLELFENNSLVANGTLSTEYIDKDIALRYIEIMNQEQDSLFDHRLGTMAAWSSTNNKLALFSQDEITILDITIVPEVKYFEGNKFNNYKATINSRDTVKLPAANSNDALWPNLMFTGDSSELYIFRSENIALPILRYSIKTKILTENILPINSSIYPIPSSPGIVYWDPANNSYEHHEMILDDENSKSVIPVNQKFDYGGDIYLSPDRNNACFETGSSGYWGYTIYDLKHDKSIKWGLQYSHCVRWIDNNNVVIEETPYWYQHYSQLFIYNIETGKKTYLNQISSSR